MLNLQAPRQEARVYLKLGCRALYAGAVKMTNPNTRICDNFIASSGLTITEQSKLSVIVVTKTSASSECFMISYFDKSV